MEMALYSERETNKKKQMKSISNNLHQGKLYYLPQHYNSKTFYYKTHIKLRNQQVTDTCLLYNLAFHLELGRYVLCFSPPFQLPVF